MTRQAEAVSLWLVPVAIIIGLTGAGLAVFGGVHALLALVGLGYVIAVLAKPELAAYVYIGLLPFLTGVERGAVVPGLRLTEVLLAATCGTVVLHYLIGKTTGQHRQPWLSQLHVAFIAMATLASVWPILWLAIRGLPIRSDDLLATLPLWKLLALPRERLHMASPGRRCSPALRVPVLHASRSPSHVRHQPVAR